MSSGTGWAMISLKNASPSRILLFQSPAPRELKGCVAQVEAWHESMGRLAAQVETLTVRLKNLGGSLSSLGFYALPLGGVVGWPSRAAAEAQRMSDYLIGRVRGRSMGSVGE